jgi:hypothetical protein
VIARRVIVGVAATALVAAGAAYVPAIGAPGDGPVRQMKRPSGLTRSGIGSFTPASADPRLAAAMARSGLNATGFRFTPSESRIGGKDVTVAVRARDARSASEIGRVASAAPSAVSLQPIAYNLGVAVGWKRFALSGDVAKVDLGALPGSRESVDLGLSYTGKRVSGRVQAGAVKAAGNQPRMVGEPDSYSVDLGTSYSLTRNLDVTAGVRYRSDEERLRLSQLSDNRRDSQAVYVGTAFRF